MKQMMHPDVDRLMLTQEEIAEKVKAIAEKLDKLYEGRTPVVVCIFKGSVIGGNFYEKRIQKGRNCHYCV